MRTRFICSNCSSRDITHMHVAAGLIRSICRSCGQFTVTSPEETALDMLRAVDRGDLTIALVTDRGATLHPEYRTANGWSFRVFDDVGGWDYIDVFRAPGGEWVDVTEGELSTWRPSNLEYWQWAFEGVSPGGYSV